MNKVFGQCTRCGGRLTNGHKCNPMKRKAKRQPITDNTPAPDNAIVGDDESGGAISFDEWLNTEADLEEMDCDVLAAAAWRAGRHNLFKNCVPKTPVYTLEEARKQVIEEIMACDELKITKYNIMAVGCSFSEKYEDTTTDEVMELLEGK